MMKKTMNTLLMFLFCAAPSVGMAQEQKDTQQPNVGLSANQDDATTSQGEKVLDSLKTTKDACSGTDLLDGHGGIDCSAVKVFDFDERAAQPAPKN